MSVSRVIPEAVLTGLSPGLVYPTLVSGIVGAMSPVLTPERGSRLRDVTGRKNHGAISGSTPISSAWVDTAHGSALYFDQSDNRVVAGSPITSSPVSISLWASRVTWWFGCGTWIGDAGAGAANGFYLNTNSSGSLLGVVAQGGSTSTISATAMIVTGEIFHAVYTYQPGSQQLFFNGALAATGTSTLQPPAFDAWTIGAENAVSGYTNYYYGNVWEVCVWNRILSYRDVHLLKSLGPGGWLRRKPQYRPYADLSAPSSVIDHTAILLRHVFAGAL